MTLIDVNDTIADRSVYLSAVRHLRRAGVVLPTFAELADPTIAPPEIAQSLRDVDPDAAHPRNLFRVHWYNDATRRGLVAAPERVVLPRELTSVDAPIIVLLGDRFPMIRAHKVLAAYACPASLYRGS
jgi:hypothetical protein